MEVYLRTTPIKKQSKNNLLKKSTRIYCNVKIRRNDKKLKIKTKLTKINH